MLELFKKPVNKAKAICTAASVATVTSATMPMVMANHDIAPEEVLGGILDLVFNIFLWIGILLLAWSIGMLVLAFKNEDADSKSKAMMLLVVSIALLGLRALFNPIAGILGIDIPDEH